MDFLSFIKKTLGDSAEIKLKTAQNLSEEIAKATEMTIKTYKRGNKILLCGNGGSAANCQHIAAELLGRFKKERNPVSAKYLFKKFKIVGLFSKNGL